MSGYTDENIKRVQIRLPVEQFDKLKAWSKKFGITMAQLGGMAAQGGLDGIIRAVSPFDSLTPEQWASITKELDKDKINKGDLIEK